jgi:predicted pyridoxine 5'-phosphate oxidase superfamily flavin-nucleotide-binding protein
MIRAWIPTRSPRSSSCAPFTPAPAERSVRKVIERLDDHCRRFISLSPFLLIATADPQGGCEVSPRGGPPGFVRVLDDHRLLIPDATGNRRLDSLQNMICNPRVGTLFLIPGMGETLRVKRTGRAQPRSAAPRRAADRRPAGPVGADPHGRSRLPTVRQGRDPLEAVAPQDLARGVRASVGGGDPQRSHRAGRSGRLGRCAGRQLHEPDLARSPSN